MATSPPPPTHVPVLTDDKRFTLPWWRWLTQNVGKSSVGPQGPAGATGPAGPAGTGASVNALDLLAIAQSDIPGPQGLQGLQGPPGFDGADGEDGAIGPPGVAGAAGAIGPTGPTGATGPTGTSGPIGPPGVDGEPGEDAIATPGPQGPQGAAGPMGPQGPIGFAIDGEDGESAWHLPSTVSISAAGGISVSPSPITGTGSVSLAAITNHAVAIGTGSSGAVHTATVGTAGFVLTDNGASADPSFQTTFPQFTGTTTPPALASFTWVNQNGGTAGSTAAQAGGTGTPILMTMVNNGGGLQWKGLFIAQPGTPYTRTAWIQRLGPAGNSAAAGIYFYDGTKLMGIEILFQCVAIIAGSPNANYTSIRVEKINSVTSDNSTAGSTGFAEAFAAPIGLRLSNDGSTLKFSFSADGYNWVQLFSEAIGTFITPTQVGWGGIMVITSGQTTSPQYINLQSWGT